MSYHKQYHAMDSAVLEMILPNPLSDNQYSDMKLVIANKSKGTQFSINLTDKLTYTLAGLVVRDSYTITLENSYGYVLSETTDIIVQKGINTIVFDNLY